MASDSIPVLTTITCTYEPNMGLLERALWAIVNQIHIVPDVIEILVVDNCSVLPVSDYICSDLKKLVRIVREENPGLTYARLAGLRFATSDLMVMVDDDNILDPDYLSIVLNAFRSKPNLGALGGRAIPVFQVEPPAWFDIGACSLGCRDLGTLPLSATWQGVSPAEREYPCCAPIGGGMAIRRAPFEKYASILANHPLRRKLDRTGESLASGGDNDIVMCVLAEGFEVGYEPALRLDHHIAKGRLTLAYLKRYQRESTRTWIQVLACNGIVPWLPIKRWTVSLRKARSYIVMRAWTSPSAMLNWQAACGAFEGRADLAEILDH